MNIENAYVRADEYLRNNLKEVKKALKGAKDKDRQLILATGAMAIIYASEMYNITLEEALKSIGANSHPAREIKEKLNSYLDDVLNRFDDYVKTQLN
jgi:ElaB/YqjD/DUF883 family membrane-anchored ribosome-binding protein